MINRGLRILEPLIISVTITTTYVVIVMPSIVIGRVISFMFALAVRMAVKIRLRLGVGERLHHMSQ